MPSNYLILCHPLLLLPSTFPSIRVFSNSQFFASGGQSIGVSASTSLLPVNTQDWSPLGWTGWISLQSKGLSSLLQYHSSKASILRRSVQLFIVHLSDPYMTAGKTIALTRRTFVGKVMSPLFNMLSRLLIAFSSKEQASFNFMAAVTICSDFGAPKIQSLIVSPSICHEVRGPDLSFLDTEF